MRLDRGFKIPRFAHTVERRISRSLKRMRIAISINAIHVRESGFWDTQLFRTSQSSFAGMRTAIAFITEIRSNRESTNSGAVGLDTTRK
jgi:hypothetical protein